MEAAKEEIEKFNKTTEKQKHGATYII